jgi:hypothetical protein
MTEPAITINGVRVNDDLYYAIDWQKSRGLFSPAMRKRATSRPTVDGDVVNVPGVRAYNPRTISLAIEAINCSSFTAVRESMARLAKAISTRPALLEIGSLRCRANFYLVEEVDDPEKTLPDRAWCTIEGEAIPGTWDAAAGYMVGRDQGIPVADDRLDRAELKMTDITGNGRVFSFTNPGTAPTELALMLSVSPVPADLNIWVRCTHPDAPVRVKAQFDAAGVLYLPPSKGLILPADTTAVFRLEKDDGSLQSAGTFKAAIVGSAMRWRFVGNDGDRFGDGPMLGFYRRGSAYAYTGINSHPASPDMAARIGLPNGAATFAAGTVGLVLEQASTNTLTSNQSTATDALGNTTGFFEADGTILYAGSTLTSDGTQYLQGTKSIKAVTTGATERQGWGIEITSAAANTRYTAGLWVLGTAGVTLRLQMRDATNGVNSTDTQLLMTGAWQFIQNSITTGANPVTSLLIGLCTTTAVGTTFYADLIKCEAGPFATSWTDGGVTRNADYCALALSHNYIDYSEAFDNAAWVKDIGNLTITRASVAGPSGVATGSKVEKTASANGRMYRAVAAWPHDKATFVIKAKAGTLGTISLGIYDTTLGSWLVNPATAANQFGLSSSFETLSVVAAVTPGHDLAFYYYVDPPATANAGYIYVTAAQANEGSMPVPYVYTAGSAVPFPSCGFDFPGGFGQNIVIEFDYVPPCNATPSGLGFCLIGDIADVALANLTLIRRGAIPATQEYIDFVNLHNGSTGVDAAGQYRSTVWTALLDGAKRTIKLVRVNYLIGTTRYMYARWYVNGTLVSSDVNVASAHGATKWVVPERLWLSKGSTYGTIRAAGNGNPLVRAPQFGSDIPSGAVPEPA